MNKIKIITLVITLMTISGCQNVDKEKAEQSGAVIKSITISDQQPDECNSPRELLEESDTNHHATILEDGRISFWGDAYISAEIDEKFNSDSFTAEWYIGETEVNPYSQEDFAETESINKYVTKWNLHSSQKGANPVKSCDGKLYLNLKTPSIESGFGVEGTWIGPRKLAILSGEEVVGEQIFYIQQ